MIITNAKYWRIPDSEVNGVKKVYPDSSIICDINGEYWGVPIDEENTHYIEIKRQLDIPRIHVTEACKDLMEVDIESMTEVN